MSVKAARRAQARLMMSNLVGIAEEVIGPHVRTTVVTPEPAAPDEEVTAREAFLNTDVDLTQAQRASLEDPHICPDTGLSYLRKGPSDSTAFKAGLTGVDFFDRDPSWSGPDPDGASKVFLTHEGVTACYRSHRPRQTPGTELRIFDIDRFNTDFRGGTGKPSGGRKGGGKPSLNPRGLDGRGRIPCNIFFAPGWRGYSASIPGDRYPVGMFKAWSCAFTRFAKHYGPKVHSVPAHTAPADSGFWFTIEETLHPTYLWETRGHGVLGQMPYEPDNVMWLLSVVCDEKYVSKEKFIES